MKRSLLLMVFAVVAMAQVGAPVTMILRREATLRLGRTYKFRTRPVDPVDAFRGRYVWLGFEQDHAPMVGGQLERGMIGYARVETGEDGFAAVRAVSAVPPKEGDYFKVRMTYPGWGSNAGAAHFNMPFDRFYLEETKAPAAERAYWEHNRRGQTNLATYAVVRVHEGDAALMELYVGGRPVAEYVKSH